MFCWGWAIDRCAKPSDPPRHYKTKEDEQGPDEVKWQEDMAVVTKSHYDAFTSYLPCLEKDQRSFLDRNAIKFTMDTAPAFSNMSVTFDFYSAKHFDRDHTWAAGVWYSQHKLSHAQQKKGAIPLTSGGHFVVPTCGVAFDLSAPCTLLVWNGSRHLHATAILETYNSLRIGTSMQVTSKHFKHETGQKYYFLPKME